MFEIEKKVREYLKLLVDKRFINQNCLEEIESHLFEEIAFLIESGLTESEACEKALAGFGDANNLQQEFASLYAKNKWAQLRNFLSYYFNRRVMMRVFFGLFFGMFFTLAGLLLEGGQISSIVQVTALIIVAGGTFGALIVAYPFRTVLSSFALAISGRNATKASYLDAAKVFKSFGDLAILAGIVGLLFGVIHVLEHLDRPDVIGLGFAVAIINILYGVLLRLFIAKPFYDSFMGKAFPSTDDFKNNGDGRKDKMMAA